MKYWFVRSPYKHRKWADVLMFGVFNLYGIRNYASKKNISRMGKGDPAIWYSSRAGKMVFGIMQVKDKAFPDKTSDNGWLAIDFIPKKSLVVPVPLTNIRDNDVLSHSNIIKQKRMSVVEIAKDEYDEIIKIGDNIKT